MTLAIVFDRLLVGGLRFVLDKVATAVDAELDDESNLKEELLATQMSYELGEIGEEELARREEDILARMREVRKQDGAGGGISFGADQGTQVEISVDQSLDDEGGGEP